MKTKEKHLAAFSPGKWSQRPNARIDSGYPENYIEILTDYSKGTNHVNTIAKLPLNRAEPPYSLTVAQIEANAILITKAPDMAKLLQKIRIKIINRSIQDYSINILNDITDLLSLPARSIKPSLQDRIDNLEADLKTSITWSVADFEQVANEQPDPKKYDPAKFQSALELMIFRHDCNDGITWSTVVWYLDNYCI